jgi:hypothetical protein
MASGGFAVLAAWFVACSGSDIPAVDGDTRQELQTTYGDEDDAAANAGTGGGDGGNGGSAMVPSGGGAAGAGGAGAPSGGGAGGGAPVAGGGSSGGGSFAGCDALDTILLDRCGTAGCHNANAINGGFAVDDLDVVREYVDAPSNYAECPQPIIDSADPENSLLYTKITDEYPVGCGNLQMPANGDFLTPDEEACVLEWLGQF